MTMSASATSLALNTASTERYRAGTDAVHLKQRSGVVQGEANGLCVAELSEDEVRSYPDWMLNTGSNAGTNASAGWSADN